MPFPGWEQVEAERLQADPVVLLTVRDADGNIVRRLEGPVTKCFHRVAWDLRMPAPNANGADRDRRAACFQAIGGMLAARPKPYPQTA